MPSAPASARITAAVVLLLFCTSLPLSSAYEYGKACAVDNDCDPTYATCYQGHCDQLCPSPSSDCSTGCESIFTVDNNQASICPWTDAECKAESIGGSLCQTVAGTLGRCSATAGVGCVVTDETDPVILGFDGKRFHFNEIGTFTMLSDGDNWQISTTFAAPQSLADVKEESSWTVAVRLHSPNGDEVACTIPAVMPNTSSVTVSAMTANGDITTLNGAETAVQLAEMSVAADLSVGPEPHIKGCKIISERMEINVYQVSGWEQATKFPSEAWAAPFTWLNMELHLLKPLPAPVTGILGSTYPASMTVDNINLHPETRDFQKIAAGIAGY